MSAVRVDFVTGHRVFVHYSAPLDLTYHASAAIRTGRNATSPVQYVFCESASALNRKSRVLANNTEKSIIFKTTYYCAVLNYLL